MQERRAGTCPTWGLLWSTGVLSQRSHTAVVNSLCQPLQVVFRFIHQFCITSDGIQPEGDKSGLAEGFIWTFQGSTGTLPFQWFPKLFITLHKSVIFKEKKRDLNRLDKYELIIRTRECKHLRISASLKPLMFSRGIVRGRPRFFGLLRSDGESLSEPEYLLLLLCRPSLALKLICSHSVQTH